MGCFSTILWDVDNTLLDFQYSQKYALNCAFSKFGLSIDDSIHEMYDQINQMFWKRFELGEVTKSELLRGRFQVLFQQLDIDFVSIEEFLSEYEGELGNVISYLDNSLELCKKLKGKVKQYVITNGVTSTQTNKLKISGLIDCMEDIFISEQVGIQKPYREFFDYCLQRIDEKDFSKILVVGDSISSDIKGAVQAGLTSCWYNPKAEENKSIYIPNYEIRNLWDVLNVVDRSDC